ncbi:MAG: hypothetical protein JWP97_2177 [Labilithrix sp.]|nr:hypothetical protein [Labilithrix sp.]
MMRATWLVLVLPFCGACSDPARFRPAKGAKEYGATKDAYRVQDAKEGCDELGFVVEAATVKDIAETAANHGGTHYRVLDDFGGTTVETDTTASRGIFGTVDAHSSSYAVKHHVFTAKVYRCL